MKKLIAIIFAISLIAPSPAQANEKIIDQMVERYNFYMATGCSKRVDNVLLFSFGWTDGDSKYPACPESNLKDPLSLAAPLVAFTPRDYNIWLSRCTTHFFQYACPQDKTQFKDIPIRSQMKKWYDLAAEILAREVARQSEHDQDMEKWNNIYKKYYPSKTHNCKPLKPFYYTAKTGYYIASAKQIDKSTYVIKSGPEYKTYKYTYTKQEQKEHMNSCISDWKRDNEWSAEMYNSYKETYLMVFDLSSYAPGKPCLINKQVVEFKGIATVKCSNSVWVKTQ